MSEKVNETLARLLATENLRVEHRRVHTAYMDLKNRLLVLPIFKQDMPKDVYDLLVGHEVGHALETPEAGWHNSLLKDFTDKLPNKGKGFKSFLNVVEDTRIERKMKTRYPGLRKSFFTGYSILHKEKFFGDFDKESLKDLLLIDRINLYYKVGAFSMVSFKEEEKKFIKMIDNCATFDDVIEAAVAIYDYCKEELKNKIEEQNKEKQEQNDDESFDDFSDDFDASDEDPFDDLDGEELDFGDEEKEEKSKKRSSSASDPSSEEELESVTDKNFRKKEQELKDGCGIESVYVKLPVIDPNDFIVPYKTAIEKMKIEFARYPYYGDLAERNYDDMLKRDLNREFLARNSKYIAYLVKEFELRKNAAQLAKERQHKTGKLDVNKIWGYRFNDEVFKNFMIVPNGKNHGMVLIIDWSGSMTNNLSATLEQVLVLATFCKKVNIPFRVYGFSSYRAYPSINGIDITKEHLQLCNNDDLYFNKVSVTMLEFLSSEMTRMEYIAMSKKLLTIAEGLRSGPIHVRDDGANYEGKVPCIQIGKGYDLGGTPLNESLFVTRFIIEKFKKENKIDVVTSILLSDGAGQYVNGKEHRPWNAMRVIYVDPLTKKEFKQNYEGGERKYSLLQTNTFVRLIRETTDTNFIGFFIFKQKHETKDFFFTKSAFDAALQTLSKKKFHIEAGLAFNEFYFIEADDFKIDSDELKVKSTDSLTKTKLRKAFLANQQKKSMNRVLLNRFIKMIA